MSESPGLLIHSRTSAIILGALSVCYPTASMSSRLVSIANDPASLAAVPN
jgi:hypothetical protein